MKSEITSNGKDLEHKFQKSLGKVKKHTYNIIQQYKTYTQIRESLDTESCMIHVDFSENYMCDYSKDIQAVHFGASHSEYIFKSLHSTRIAISIQV